MTKQNESESSILAILIGYLFLVAIITLVLYGWNKLSPDPQYEVQKPSDKVLAESKARQLKQQQEMDRYEEEIRRKRSQQELNKYLGIEEPRGKTEEPFVIPRQEPKPIDYSNLDLSGGRRSSPKTEKKLDEPLNGNVRDELKNKNSEPTEK